jgi:GntR family transcriptional repressor for pyruvate dehydrogenase complex
MAENSQSNKVYEYVLDKIKANKWTAGERIYSENELCHKLEVSRIAVREALEKFSALGILDKRRGAGTYVCDIDINKILSNVVPLMTLKPMDILDVLRFRLYLETGNVIEFMKNHSKEDIEELKKTYEQMKNHIADNKDFYTADYEFHRIIAKGTKNQLVISINEMLTGVLVTSQELINLKVGPEIGLRFHGDIIQAIDNGDAQMASLLMTRHIEATINCIEEQSKNGDEIQRRAAAAH